jgi:hypothetical protein
VETHTHLCIISSSFIFRMRNVSSKSCREYHSTHFMFHNFFFENLAIYDIMRKNIVEWCGPQMTIWRRCIAFWIPKATNKYTHSGCVMLTVLTLQRWLHERASVLRYTLHLHCFYCYFIYNLFVLFFFTLTSSFLLIYSAIKFLPFFSEWE